MGGRACSLSGCRDDVRALPLPASWDFVALDQKVLIEFRTFVKSV